MNPPKLVCGWALEPGKRSQQQEIFLNVKRIVKCSNAELSKYGQGKFKESIKVWYMLCFIILKKIII